MTIRNYAQQKTLRIEGMTVFPELGVFQRYQALYANLIEDFKKLKDVMPKEAHARLVANSGLVVNRLLVSHTYPWCRDPEVADSYHVDPWYLRSRYNTPSKGGKRSLGIL